MKKRHHFIPQFYLKGFCDPETPSGQAPFLWVRAIHSDAVYRRAPNNLAAEIGCYKCEGSDPDQMEDELSAMESRAAFALRSFLNQPGGSRSVPEDLGNFLAWLGARTPSFRRIAQEGWMDFLCNAPWGTEELPSPTSYAISLRHIASGELRREAVSSALPLLGSGNWIALLDQSQYVDFIRLQAWCFQNRLPSLTWILLTAPNGHSFLTSDRPLVWLIPGRGFADSPAALKDPGVEVTVPLNSRYALLAFSKEAAPPAEVKVLNINVRTMVYAEKFVAGPSPDGIEAAFSAASRLPLVPLHP